MNIHLLFLPREGLSSDLDDSMVEDDDTMMEDDVEALALKPSVKFNCVADPVLGSKLKLRQKTPAVLASLVLN